MNHPQTLPRAQAGISTCLPSQWETAPMARSPGWGVGVGVGVGSDLPLLL